MRFTIFIICLALVLVSGEALSQVNLDKKIEKHQASLEQLYATLHQHPELSLMEFNTAKKMTSGLESLGFEVHEGFSGNTLVGLYKNGKGPVIMVRTDLDALPIKEKTGLAYASQVITRDQEGNEVAAMHACGHDMHMTVWTGTARLMVELKDHWKGTLMMIAQEAEELGEGAGRAIEAGLYETFPVPDYALAFHVSERYPTGSIAYKSGPITAGVSSVNITIFGEGGHGALPEQSIDPIVLASRMILDLQTIVSREISPLEPAVVTVGSIHGGTKHNIIPDEVKLQLTLRYYDPAVGESIIAALERIGDGLAASAGLPPEKYPVVEVEGKPTLPVINDPELTSRIVPVLKSVLGEDNVVETPSLMVGEDFGAYGLTPEDVPISLMWLGSIDPARLSSGEAIPGLHNPGYYPDYSECIKTGVKGMVSMLMELYRE